MKFIKKNWHKLFLTLFTFFAPVFVVLADTSGTIVNSSCSTPSSPAGSGMILNPINVTSVPCLIQTILTGVLTIGIPIVALAIIYCGFLFVFARGNSEKLTKAKEALLYTLIGAAILLGAWAIAQMISATVLAL